MLRNVADLMTPRILVVDDERQIHASLRLRLGRDYDLTCCFEGKEALEQLSRDRFDLCFVDLHMPRMDGFTFIDSAREGDPGLGYVILSAFDSDDNLRRTIPLQVYDFVSKPLPERVDFEERITGWVDQTRHRRRQLDLAARAGTMVGDLGSAQLEREVEIVASETARDALLQTASLLTTVHAHLVSASSVLAVRVKSDPGVAPLLRNLEEARRTADAAVAVAQSFFDSAYGSRDSSPAILAEGVRDAISVAKRISRAEDSNKVVDFGSFDSHLSIRGLSGISFLLMMVPALGTALSLAAPNTTVGIHGEHCARLDAAVKDSRLRNYLWVNRRNALSSHAGVLLTISGSAPALGRAEVEAWLNGEYAPLAALTPQGLLAGIIKCQGLLGFSLAPQADQFRLVLVLPA